MSDYAPLKSNNAIDEMAFVLVFRDELDNTTLASLFNLKEELGDSLPDFEVVNSFKLVIDNQSPQMPVAKQGGVALSKKSLNTVGRLEWSLRIETNKITIGCSEFTNWKDIWPQAKHFLFCGLSKFDTTSNPVIEVIYKCVDKFIFGGESGNYELQELFDVKSRYLSRNLTELDASAWHLHQGWFMFLQNKQVKALHNLNISGLKKSEMPHETIVSHLIKVRHIDDLPITDQDVLVGDGNTPGYIERAIIESHEANKRVLKGLLNQRMLVAIGMD